MAVRVGGRNFERPGIIRDRPRPQNTGLAKRAHARLDFEADNAAAQRNNSIEVDPTNVLIWNRGAGSVPCTCTPTDDPIANTNRAAALNPADKSPAAQATRWNAGGWSQKNTGEYSTDDFEHGSANRNARNPIEPDLDADFPDVIDGSNNDPNDNSLAALSRVVDSGAFSSGQMVKCPICFGTGYTDAYRPQRVSRLLGDFAPTTTVSNTGGNLDVQAHPNAFKLTRNASVVWNLFVPRYFENTIRVAVWNGLQRVAVVPQVQLASGWTDATLAAIDSLNGTGGLTNFRLTSAANPYVFTHIEILIGVAPYLHAFIPELNIPYDIEFVDYNTNVDIELPSTAVLGPGDLLSEQKHGRLWLASTIDRNRLANGKSTALTANFRAVANDEVYHNAGIFTEPRQL